MAASRGAPGRKGAGPQEHEVIFCAAGVITSRAFGMADNFLHTTAHDHFDRRNGARKFGTKIFRRLSGVALHQRKRARAVPARRNIAGATCPGPRRGAHQRPRLPVSSPYLSLCIETVSR